VISVRLDDGRVEGVPLLRRGPLELFFSGYLVQAARNRRAPMTDGELVLQAVSQHGLEALRSLRGSFAFVLTDRQTGKTVVGRDPMGFHPLYHAEVRGALLFAASALHLTRMPGVSGDLNTAVLADHLCHRWSQSPTETYLKSVQRLSPGCFGVIAGGRLQTERTFDPMPEGQPIRWLTEEDMHQFPQLFEQAVDRSLSLGNPGIFLSGGLDSISIAVMAADRAREAGRAAPHALSLAFPTPETDERQEQTATAAMLSMPQCLLPFEDAVGPAGLLRPALELNRHLSSPLLNRWEPAYASLARRGRQLGVEVVLSGSGGDEWLTVTPMLAADLIRRGEVRQLLSFVSAWRRSYRYPRRLLYRNAFWRFGASPLLSQAYRAMLPGPWARRRMRNYRSAAPSWVAPDPAVRKTLDERLAAQVTRPAPPDGFYVQELRESLQHPLVSLEREERFEFGRLNGVRYSYPFWDPDLVDLLMRTPPEYLNRNGRSKGLVRQTVAARMPDLNFDRQIKRTGTSFSRTLIAAEGRSLFAELGETKVLGDLGIVDPCMARSFVGAALDGDTADLYRVWDLLNLEYWVRTRLN
jgi:asparagine synthase (glutamine-hydrolysing)